MPATVSKPNMFEGTWEEIQAHGVEWEGQKLRLSVLSDTETADISHVASPRIGTGTFEEIMTLVQTFTPPKDEEDLLDTILEDRAIRRKDAKELKR